MEKGRSPQVKLLEELQFDAYGVASLRASGLEEKRDKEWLWKTSSRVKVLKKWQIIPCEAVQVPEVKGVKKA